MRERKVPYALNVKIIAALAMLCALSVILGKYLQIPIGEIMRFSFENLPIIFAGIAFGPACGMLVGTVADLIGCLLVGYAINPIITLGAALCGAVSGICAIALKSVKLPQAAKICISVILAHIVGSVLVKTFGLAKFYDMPMGILMLWRLLNYTIVGMLECILLSVLLKSRAVNNAIGTIMRTNRASKKNESNGYLNEDKHNG